MIHKSKSKKQIRFMRPVRYEHIVKTANNAMLDARNQLVGLSIPAFVSQNLQLTTSITEAADITVAHRIINKFGEPSGSSLRDVAFENYKLFERHLEEFPRFSNLWECEEGYVMRKALVNLSTWLKTFKLDYNSINIEFTPGESYTTASGHVSIYAKLSDLRHWTCTADIVDDVCHLVYYNRGFKAAARKHIGRMVPQIDETGFETFSRYLTDILSIVPGARGASVPKNQVTDRFINVEPTFNMILQRWVSGEISRCLTLAKNKLGASYTINKRVVYHDAQELHKEMIRDMNYATIDFSNASDSVMKWVVDLLFPGHVSRYLNTFRSHTVQLGQDLIVPHKLSSMGNGFTFEVMTILLLAFARVFDDTARVYGDDVIIKANVAERFIKCVGLIGFNTNEKKTFIQGPFRESCGSFQWCSTDIVSYDFSWCNNLADVITTTNKLLRIIESEQISESVRLILESTRDVIFQAVPVLCKGPRPDSFELHLSSYVYDEKWRSRQMKSELAVTTLTRLVDKNWGFFSATSLAPSEVCIVHIPMYVPRSVKVDKKFNLIHAFSNLYSFRSTRPAIRGKGKWVNVPCVVTQQGAVFRLSRIRRSFPNLGEVPDHVMNGLLAIKGNSK